MSKDEYYDAIDLCPNCGHENSFNTKYGYVQKCEKCGEPMMLCDACGYCDNNGEWHRDECDQYYENGCMICHRGKHKY